MKQSNQHTKKPTDKQKQNKNTNTHKTKTKQTRRPDGSVGMALVLPALTDCWWWFESLRESQVRPAERQRAPTTKKTKTKQTKNNKHTRAVM